MKNILRQYVRDNETKIYQSANPHFSGWVDIIDGQDGNMYLYVGEKKDSGGREIKIGIQKSEFENCKRDEDDTPNKALEAFWDLFTIDRSRTPTEEREYYSSKEGLEEEFQESWKHRRKLCRSYLESLRSRMAEKLSYWEKQPESKEKNSGIVKSHARITEIDYELKDMKTNRPTYYSACDNDCNICGVKLCCHYEGRACEKGKKWLFFSPEKEELNYCSLHWESDSKSSTQSKPSQKDNRINNTEKSQLLQYFLENDIESIELDGETLIIEYKNQEKKIREIDNQELKQIQKSLQNKPNQYLSLAQLQANNNNHSNPNPDNHKLTIGLIVGGVILMGIIIIYLFAHKKKKNW